MANSPKRIETLVGFFLFVGLAMLGVLIMQFGRFADRFRGVYSLTVTFSDASGLIKGSQVRLSGAQVGQVVEEPSLTDEGEIEVDVVIRKSTPKIDRNSVFQVTSLSILGDKAITISPPRPPEQKSGTYIKDGDFIIGSEAGGLDALQTDAEQIASDAAALISRGKTTLTKVDNALDDLRTVSGQLSESLDKINSGLITDDNIAKISRSLENLDGATESIREASSEIKPLIAGAQDAMASFDSAAKAAEGTFSQASSEISKLGPTLQKVPEAVDSISEVATEARGALNSVTKSEGLLGSLAYDRDMKGDAKTFMRNLRHYGILRYKDAETPEENDPRDRFRGKRR